MDYLKEWGDEEENVVLKLKIGKINGEKHAHPGQNIECINKAFKVRFENILIPTYARAGKRMPEKIKKR